MHPKTKLTASETINRVRDKHGHFSSTISLLDEFLILTLFESIAKVPIVASMVTLLNCDTTSSIMEEIFPSEVVICFHLVFMKNSLGN